MQLCTSRDSRLHHDADIEVELKGSDLTQIHAEPELSSKNWVQTFFKHFSSMNLFLSGKKEIIHNGNNEADDNDGWLVENDVQ